MIENKFLCKTMRRYTLLDLRNEKIMVTRNNVSAFLVVEEIVVGITLDVIPIDL